MRGKGRCGKEEVRKGGREGRVEGRIKSKLGGKESKERRERWGEG